MGCLMVCVLGQSGRVVQVSHAGMGNALLLALDPPQGSGSTCACKISAQAHSTFPYSCQATSCR